MRKSHFYEQSLVLLGPIISKFLHVQMRKKNYPKLLSVHVLVLSLWLKSGNIKGGSITVPLTSCLTGLESAVYLMTIFVFICKTD
jgi:hypothetical protein